MMNLRIREIISRQFSSKYKNKVMLSFFALVMFPIIVLLIMGHTTLIASHKSELIRRERGDFDNSVSKIDGEMGKLVSGVSQLKANSTLKNFFRTSEFSGDMLFAYHQYIENILTWQNMAKPGAVASYTFFTENANLPRSEQIRLIEDLPSPMTLDLMKESFSRMGYAVLMFEDLYTDGKGKYSYSRGYYLFYPFIIQDGIYTVIQVELDIDGLLSSLEKHSWSTHVLSFHEAGYYYAETDSYSKDFIKPQLNKKDLLTHSSMIFDDLGEVTKFTSQSRLLMDVRKMERQFWLIVTGCILALTLIIYLFASALTEKLVNVSNRIAGMKDDSFELFLSAKDHDEVDILIDHINSLTSRVQNLTEKRFETELQLKKTEIRALQNQITPHFLYNTLESFKMLALINNQNELSEGLTSLGQLLRYYTKTGNRVSSLEQELNSVKDYICIQNLLQNDRITLETSMEDRLLENPLPNLTLQPIIENVIKHGTEQPFDPIRITIGTRETDTGLILDISDNGKGIRPPIIESLNERFATSHRYDSPETDTHIGLINVNQRIKLLMGESSGLYLDPEPAAGTHISLMIPRNAKGEKG